MALCEHCRAEMVGEAERLPPPWFDHNTHQVAGNSVPKLLWDVLVILWRRRSRMVSTDSLMALLYENQPNPPHDDIIKVLICKLRTFLDPTPYGIATHWNEGYQLVDRARVAVQAISLGEPETGVKPPERLVPNLGNDKYDFASLKPGQSRVVVGVSLGALRSACRKADERGIGRFKAGYGDDAKMRIWRLE